MIMKQQRKSLFKHQRGKLSLAFTPLLLFLSFVGSNVYYINAFEYLNNLQGFSPLFKPNPQQEMAFTTSMVDVSKLFMSTPQEIETNDAMAVCNYWRKESEKNNSWSNRLKANEECVNAILQRIAQLDEAGRPK